MSGLLGGRKVRQANQFLDEGKTHFNEKRYKEAITVFTKAKNIFKALKMTTERNAAEGWEKRAEGLLFGKNKDLLSSMKSLGRSSVLFMQAGLEDELKFVRAEQAETQLALATEKAKESDFLEAAKLYEAAGAIFKMAGMEREAAMARARSLVDRAALSENDFDKAKYLGTAVEEFKKAKEESTLIEGHYLYYKGKTLINTNAQQSINFFVRAIKKYQKVGQTTQVEKVVKLLKELKERVKTRPSEFRKTHSKRSRY